uniref:CSON001091 protein n=1 Tax=Culicoides sonorensis TaxID=179676 RepID=A0A336MGE3_CULSO
MIRNILSHAKLSSYHPIERYYWIFSIFVVFGMSFIPISSFVFKFLTNPINVSVDRNYFHFNLTFPSVTLCLHDRLNETAMNEFVSSNEKISKKQLVKFLFDLAYFDIDSNLDQLTKFTKIHPNEYIPVFNPITYYDKHRRNKDVEIYKVNFFDIETEASLSYQYIGSNFDIYLHGQMELPSRKSVIRTERGQASYIKLLFTTHAITSDSNVKSLAIFQRKCRFDDESNLLYFPGHYSPSLCQLNCKLSAYEKHCGCIPFFYHYVTPETNQCSHSGLKCIHKKARKLTLI